jgi:hypothetical protein
MNLSRRTFVSSLAGLSVSGWLDGLARHASATEPNVRRPKRCILLWMTGGPSQIDTFDMKPDGPVDIRGEFRPIATAVPGIQITEHLPRLARHMRDMVILRSLNTGTARPPHNLAYRSIRLFKENPLEPVSRPHIGSIVSSSRPANDIGYPNFILLGLPPGLRPSDTTPGFLGPRHAPWVVPPTLGGLDHLSPPVSEPTLRDRMDIVRQMDADFAARSPLAQAHQANYQAALRLMRTERPHLFDLAREADRLREAYGRTPFGQACLQARRLSEAGVAFVEVVMGRDNGDGLWDTHNDNFNRTKTMCAELDVAMSALLEDLRVRGLLDETLVIWMGEMGRTPEITRGNAGREHFVSAWSIVLAGGGLRTGQVVGRTSRDGEEVADRPIRAHDFLATICLALGIDPASEYDIQTGVRVSPGDRIPPERRVRLANASAEPVRDIL